MLRFLLFRFLPRRLMPLLTLVELLLLIRAWRRRPTTTTPPPRTIAPTRTA